MTSIIKVDTLQKANGATPTAADLGINTTGTVLQVKQTHIASNAISFSGDVSDIISCKLFLSYKEATTSINISSSAPFS